MRAALSAGATLARSVLPGGRGASPGGQPCVQQPPEVLVGGVDRLPGQRLCSRLRGSGFEVRAVADGMSVLAEAVALPPTAVVLDWIIPGMGGRETCAQLRRHPALDRVLVVLITARGDGSQVTEAFQSGADAVLTQGFQAGELIDVLRHRAAGNNPRRRA